MPHPRVTPEMIRLYDRFTHETLDRRELMAGLTRLAGSAAAASAVLGLIAPGSAAAAEVEPGDPRISAQRVQWPVANSRTMKGYFATPRPLPDTRSAGAVIHDDPGSTGRQSRWEREFQNRCSPVAAEYIKKK